MSHSYVWKYWDQSISSVGAGVPVVILQACNVAILLFPAGCSGGRKEVGEERILHCSVAASLPATPRAVQCSSEKHCGPIFGASPEILKTSSATPLEVTHHYTALIQNIPPQYLPAEETGKPVFPRNQNHKDDSIRNDTHFALKD